jgi:PhoH-like ATPase
LNKCFVIDTNVLLYDSSSIFKFGKNTVFIPLVVIEELDRFKRDQNENGRNARQFARLVDRLRKKGSLAKGVDLANRGRLIISTGPEPTKKDHLLIDFNQNDNKILLAAIGLSEQNEEVTLVTKDINLRLKADAVGIRAEDYGEQDLDLTSVDQLYSGQKVQEFTLDRLTEFEAERFLALKDQELKQLLPNQYVTMIDKNNTHYRLYGRYCAKKKGIVPLIKFREGMWGIHAKNVEQQFAMDALLNNEVKLVSLVGKAGTGKTLLAIAAGLEMTISKNDYARVLVSRPIQPMGRDLGFLPGDVSEKLAPWMQPIFDNIDFLFGNQRIGSEAGSWEELINQGLLHVEPLTYIRGRSIPSQYMIVDEAQNLTPHEIKTIITRAGEGTKIVLTGDCEQIDSPYLDSVNNGLAYCVERLKNEEIVSHTSLTIGERSELSEIASKYL